MLELISDVSYLITRFSYFLYVTLFRRLYPNINNYYYSTESKGKC